MTISFATGRLGNQLFEYAYILSHTEENEKIFLYFFDDLYRVFDLQKKHIHPASKSKFSIWFHHKLWRLFIKLREANKISWIKENTDSWIVDDFRKKSKINFIEGYFQNDSAITPDFLNSIQFKKEIQSDGNNILKTFPKDKSLCFIHIRHGDYDKNMRLPDEYYLKALKKFNQQDTFFYIAGDDPDWASDFFSFLPHKCVSKNAMSTDLYIISQCKGGIISNSTFAYWGAILGTNNKTVYAPEYWIGRKEKKWNPSEKIKTSRFTYL